MAADIRLWKISHRLRREKVKSKETKMSQEWMCAYLNTWEYAFNSKLSSPISKATDLRPGRWRRMDKIRAHWTQSSPKRRRWSWMFLAKCVFTRVELFQGAFISQKPPSEEMRQVGRWFVLHDNKRRLSIRPIVQQWATSTNLHYCQPAGERSPRRRNNTASSA